MTNKQTAATLCALGGNAIFGFSFMFSRIALGVATPFVMLTYRFILAVLGLSVAAAWSVKRKNPPKESEDFMRFNQRRMESDLRVAVAAASRLSLRGSNWVRALPDG